MRIEGPMALEYLDNLRESLREREIEVSPAIESGVASDKIIEYAEVNDVDLIIMSNYSRSGLGRLVFGSVTDIVLETWNMPVLIIYPNNWDLNGKEAETLIKAQITI
jgi:nucleotide-binding universal stress UspA family protein